MCVLPVGNVVARAIMLLGCRGVVAEGKSIKHLKISVGCVEGGLQHILCAAASYGICEFLGRQEWMTGWMKSVMIVTRKTSDLTCRHFFYRRLQR
jgi:hypothetical protein